MAETVMRTDVRRQLFERPRFPWTYKTLKIGKLIGAPVPGTMTAVWWETQIDPSIVFGIPQVGMQDMQGRYLENQQLEPDIEVYNSPNHS